MKFYQGKNRTMKTKLTQSIINSFPNPDKRTVLRDSMINGLFLRVEVSGRKTWYLDYKKNGKRRWHVIGNAEFFALAEARNEARAFLGLLARGEDPVARDPDPQLTLKELIEKYYEPWVVVHRKSGGSTVKAIKSYFSAFLNKTISEITVPDIEEWRSKQRNKGKKAASCNRNVGALRSMLNWAVSREIVADNPIAKLEPLKEIDSNRKVRYLTKDENDRLMAALDARESDVRKGRVYGYSQIPLKGEFADHLKPMVLISLNTGIRWGSLVSLQWGDVDLTGRSVTIRAETAKSERQLIIPLNKTATETFRQWKEESREKAAKALVFPSPIGGGVLDNVRKAWNGILKKAGITDFRWHDMRHTFASNLVMSGVDLNTVRELLGHADLKMTLRYAHLAPKVKMSAVERLDEKRCI